MERPKDSKVDVLKSEETLLLDHQYDGIQELDHVLPRWWLWILYGSIVFSAWYVGYYMSGVGPTPQQELEVELKKIEALRPATAPAEGGGDTDLLAAVGNPEKISKGREVFTGKCVACHGEAGQGVIGPNLTDDYWIHGNGDVQSIAKTVREGVADKGMPPWGPILSPAEVRDVVVFVHSLHGTNPAGAKPAQGEKYEFKD